MKDRMADLGFKDDADSIIRSCHLTLQDGQDMDVDGQNGTKRTADETSS